MSSVWLSTEMEGIVIMTTEIDTKVPWLDALELPVERHNEVLRTVVRLRQAEGLLRDSLALLGASDEAAIYDWVKKTVRYGGDAGTVARVPASPPCEKPPAGWICSRDKGHAPPCAASELSASDANKRFRCEGCRQTVLQSDLDEENHCRSCRGEGPPVAVLASSRDWSLSIVLYPSGPCLELVEVVEDQVSRVSYSEAVANLVLAGEVLKGKQ